MLVAVDGIPGSARAVTVAFEIAEKTGSKLFLVHVESTSAKVQFSMMSDSDRSLLVRTEFDTGVLSP